MINLKSALLLLAATEAASAFCPDDPPFVGRTHSTGFAKRSRNTPKIYNTFDNESSRGGDFGNYFFNEKDRFMLNELKQKIAEQSNPYRELFGTKIKSKPTKPESVHIILFNPNTDEEGVHTIEFPKGSGNNVILAFESKEECDKFSKTLKEQHFFEPVRQKMPLKTLEAYCESIGVFVQVVPDGMDIRPPTDNVKNLGHNPELRHAQETLDYLFDMVELTDELDEDGVVLVEDGWGGSWE